MPRPDKASEILGGFVEDATLEYEALAADLDAELIAIAKAHARETARRRREIERITQQRDRFRERAEAARAARALLPGGQTWAAA